MAFVAAVAAVSLLAAACGGGDSEDKAPETKAEWQRRNGPVVQDLGAALDRVQAATKEGEPVGIRTNCEGLRDSLQEARGTLPVPDAAADAALRRALDQTATGAGTCLRAMATGDARVLERSITELREARLQLDTANTRLGSG
jgi:hypothetical protein